MGSRSGRLAGIVATVALALVPAAASAAPTRRAQVRAAVQAVMAEEDIPGVIVGVWERGEEPVVEALGSRTVDPASGQDSPPNMTPGLFMRIGSETKTFTATAVLQLVGEGKVGLEDPISEYVKGVPNGGAITVRELGDMRSGLVDFTDNEAWEAEYLAAPTRTWTPRQLLAASFALPPSFPPGQSYEYSNTNYVLLGLLVEKVTGERIGPYVERHILAPLHLEHTSVPSGAGFPRPHADGYMLEAPGGPLVDTTKWNFSWAWSAGTMISTLHDLRIWAKAVATGALLKPAIQRQRERFVPFPYSAQAGYGFGLFDVNGWIGHDGAVPGYESLTVYLPAKEATMVILLNSDADIEANTRLGEVVSEVVTPGQPFSFGGSTQGAPA
jgi:D-alanyl-D-alanine carboxypeptidase